MIFASNLQEEELIYFLDFQLVGRHSVDGHYQGSQKYQNEQCQNVEKIPYQREHEEGAPWKINVQRHPFPRSSATSLPRRMVDA